MKQALLFYLFLLLSNTTAFSQHQFENSNTNRLDGDIWVLDSVHYYISSINKDLYLSSRNIVTSRNNRGDITSRLYLDRNTEYEDWVKTSRYTQSYYDNGKKNEYKLQFFDTKKNIWIDSCQYKKHDNTGLLTIDVFLSYDQTLGIYAFGNKVFKKYNGDKKVIERKRLTWDIDKQKWANKELELTDYTDNGNTKKTVSKIWSKGSNTWVNKSIKEWKYNSDSTLIEYISIRWINNLWVNSTKEKKEYTSDGKLKIILNQKWNASEDNWENVYKYSYEYDGDNLINALKQHWITKDKKWKDLTLEIKKYDDDSLLIDYIKYNYPENSSGEVTGTRILNDYNLNKKISTEVKKVWNDEKKAWENDIKWDYDYNDGSTVITNYWDKEKKEWIPKTFYKFVLDSQGRTVLGLRKKWNIEESKWINKTKNVREYDNFNHLINNYNFGWYVNNWILVSKRHYFWSKFNTNNTDELTDDGFVLFPNPAVNVLNLSYDLNKSVGKLNIYSLSGNKVLEISSPSYDKIDISQLVSGVYVLRINTAKGTVSKLFRVEKCPND